ncbi:MAG: 3-methylornithyl-N6-L-lysine dehydrogenase PylD [Thermodesulfovibrionales bacterium]
MTRLYYDIIKDIPASLPELDHQVLRSTGHSLLGVSARTVGESFPVLAREITRYSAAVVPVSSGAGVIPGFAECVAAILCHIGIDAFVTRGSDIAGIGEAFRRGADAFFAADDHEFLALNTATSRVVDNSRATAEGFVQALAAAVEASGTQVAGKEVLVLGLGPVGRYAVEELLKQRACIRVFDSDAGKLRSFAVQYQNVRCVLSLEAALQGVDYILDATPATGIITEDRITPRMIVSAPGVPHGLTRAAADTLGLRLIHDPLPLGVVTMAVQCFFCSDLSRGARECTESPSRLLSDPPFFRTA